MPSAPKLDISPNDLKIVLEILERHVPDREVWAFGSRATWKTKDYSDLDLAVIGDTPLPLAVSATLSDDFAESDLPFKVDVVDWATTSETFRRIIERDKVIIRDGCIAHWSEYTVEQIKADTDNALATGPFGSAISSRHFQDHGTPVIRGSNLSSSIGERLIEENFVFVDDAKTKEFRRSVVRRGDIIFTCWGTVDQVGMIDHHAKHEKYIISNKQMKLTPNPAVADSTFLYYLFSSPEFRDRILAQAIGSSVPGFNLGQLRTMKLCLPRLAEQQGIAATLGTLDEKIDANRRMNATLEAMAQALFKSWFVDFEPVRAKMEGRRPDGLDDETAVLFSQSFGSDGLPTGWSLGTLSSACELNPPERLFKNSEAPYLDMAALPTIGCSHDRAIRRNFTSGSKFRDRDTLLARITPCLENGKTAFASGLGDGVVGWGSTEFIVIRPKPPFPAEYGYLVARDENFRQFAIQSMTGSSGRQRVQPDQIEKYKVALPPQAVAERFGSIIGPWFHRIRVNAEESRTLAQLRDQLLPKLLSGELRIPDAEKAIEAVA